MSRKIWINSDFVDWNDAKVHILSHSHQRGSLIFGFIPIFENDNGVFVFRINKHTERIFKSCEIAGIPIAYTKENIKKAIIDTVQVNPGSKFVKISVYIASVEIDVVPQDPFTTVAIAAYEPQEDIIAKNSQPFHSSPELSVWVEKVRHQRRSDIIAPQVKIAANYTSPMMAKWEARKQGYDEIILTDEDGYVTEAPTSNVFIVNAKGILMTAHEDDVLHGITRMSILEITEDESIETNIGRVPLKDLEEAREVFVTSSSHLVCPVIKIDGSPVGDGKIGEVTERLKNRFHEIIKGKENKFQHWLHKI
ncbi:MAG: aminotransferase class IV [Pseudomonadota bacterium]|nr:aminotransferase class IV [Pseudomonadota bacterium]MEE3295371.1 aminotransferase class IV [Pseudomonadota bacterium]